MKTNTNKNQKSELKSRPEQSSTGQDQKQGTTKEVSKHYVNYKDREANRKLPQDRILKILERWMPLQRKMASVVGSWIWIQFKSEPPAEIRRDLSQLGFHWNRKRQLWQHPCGSTATEPAAAATGN
jgi:hypothetical protein